MGRDKFLGSGENFFISLRFLPETFGFLQDFFLGFLPKFFRFLQDFFFSTLHAVATAALRER